MNPARIDGAMNPQCFKATQICIVNIANGVIMKTPKFRLAAACSILLFSSSLAYGKDVIDLEYAPRSSVYENAFGVGYYQMEDEGIGLYGNVLATISKREPLYPSLNVTSFGDPVVATYKELSMINIGATKKLHENFGIYAGIGYASAKAVAQKQDPLGILGSNGTYYVNDPQQDNSGANLNAGIILMLDKFALNIGINSFTGTAYFGFGAGF